MRFGKSNTSASLSASAQVRIHGQYVKSLEFESPIAASWVRGSEEGANIDIQVDVTTRSVQGNLSECAIEVKAVASTSNDTVYSFTLVYAGLFDLEDVPSQSRRAVLNVSCPAIIFPGLRNVVGTLTHEAGVGALWLDPLDWAALYRQNLPGQHANRSEEAFALSGSVQRSRGF